MKIIIFILFIVPICMMAQQVDIEKIEIKLMLCEKHRYTIDNIPVFVNIKNNNSVPVKLLSPYDKKGNICLALNLYVSAQINRGKAHQYLSSLEI